MMISNALINLLPRAEMIDDSHDRLEPLENIVHDGGGHVSVWLDLRG